jgi:putative sterol carrier protein
MTKSAEVFKQIDAAFKSFDAKEAEKLAKQAKAVFLFEIKDGSNVQHFTVDLKSGSPQVKEGKPAKADVTITTDDALFVQLFEGKANAQKAFMQGKIKVKGQMMLATKLDNLFKGVRAKANL